MRDTCVLPFVLALAANPDYTSTHMRPNSAPRILPSAVWRPLVALLVAAQVLLAFAPLAEWQFGADARSHVEAAGTSVHHAHNSSECAACSARALLAIPDQPGQPAIETLQSVAPGLGIRDAQLALLSQSQSRPRAPPFRQA